MSRLSAVCKESMKRIGEIVLFLAALLGLWLMSEWMYESGGFADPVKDLYFWSGWLSFLALIFGLLVRKWGRLLGHCALIFALWHTLIFIAFDFGFAWYLMWDDMLQKHYLAVGGLALALMLILGGFSFCGRFFRALVWCVFVCVALSLAHIVMIQKILGLAYWLVLLGTLGVLGYKIVCKIICRAFKKHKSHE